MKKTILLILTLILNLVIKEVKADFTFGEPMNLGPAINSDSVDVLPTITADGLECYFTSSRLGGHGGLDLWVTERVTTEDSWSHSKNVDAPINSASDDGAPTISKDGLSLYFSSNRAGGHGNFDLYVATRPSRSDAWSTPVNLGQTVNTSADQWASSLSADGLELYFCDWHVYMPNGYGNGDIWVSTRASISDAWNPPVNLGPIVNSAYFDAGMDVSDDGLRLFFGCDRTGGYGYQDIWVATRASMSDSWEPPVNLGPPVNSNGYDATPRLTPDGSTMYFGSTRGGGYGDWDLWQVPIRPIVDLNSDGVVDATDMCIIVDHWGEDYSLCDIGPMPWGDGVVDVEDLKVLAEYLFEIYPSAETVDVNEADNGGQIELEQGQILIVTLESNPSTGYQLEILENNESILKQFGQVEFKPSETTEPPMVGAGGWEIFRFKAVNAGQTTLELVYHRSWEDAEPLKNFSIQVTVN